MVKKGNHPLLWLQLRLVNYYKFPRMSEWDVHVFFWMFTKTWKNRRWDGDPRNPRFMMIYCQIIVIKFPYSYHNIITAIASVWGFCPQRPRASAGNSPCCRRRKNVWRIPTRPHCETHKEFPCWILVTVRWCQKELGEPEVQVNRRVFWWRSLIHRLFYWDILRIEQLYVFPHVFFCDCPTRCRQGLLLIGF